MITDSLVVALVTLAAGLLVALALRRLPSVRLQLVGLALMAVTLPLAAVLLSGVVMLHMGRQLEVVAAAVAAGAAGTVAALLLARTISVRLDRVRRASVQLAAGDLSERAPEGGPAEIAELAASFNAMAGHLEEVFDARRQLVAWASHDLRAPVTSLKAMLEAIDDGVVEADHYLPQLREQVRLLESLVQEVFELACIDAGAQVVRARVADLRGVVNDGLAPFGPEAAARGVTLLGPEQGDERDASAWCDPAMVERVLANLVANALRHSPVGGEVAVSVGSGPRTVRVTVADEGPGIPPEALERVFEPFFRHDEARTPGRGGAGLGLAIARGLVEAQAGRIWAEASDRGARLCFDLPRAPGAPGPDPAVPTAAVPVPAAASTDD